MDDSKDWLASILSDYLKRIGALEVEMEQLKERVVDLEDICCEDEE